MSERLGPGLSLPKTISAAPVAADFFWLQIVIVC